MAAPKLYQFADDNGEGSAAEFYDDDSAAKEGARKWLEKHPKATKVTVTPMNRDSFDVTLILPRFGGQSDYAAIFVACIFNSNSIGLT